MQNRTILIENHAISDEATKDFRASLEKENLRYLITNNLWGSRTEDILHLRGDFVKVKRQHLDPPYVEGI